MENENTPESSNTNCSHPPCKSQNQGQSPQSSKNSDKMISLVTDETDSGLNGIPSKQSKNQSKSGNKPIDHFYKRLFNTNGNNENTSCDSKINLIFNRIRRNSLNQYSKMMIQLPHLQLHPFKIFLLLLFPTNPNI